MHSPLVLHTITLLKFYARSRLILGFTVLVLAVGGLSMVPLFLFDSSGGRFETLKAMSSQMHVMVWFWTAGLGLFAVWSHTHSRNTSLVFTRPGRPEAWTAAVFLSAFTVAFLAHVSAAALTLALTRIWGLPFQMGFVWIMLDSMFESIVIISGLTALAAAIHPVIAVIAFMVFSESMFYHLDTMLLGYMHGSSPGIGLRTAEWLVRAVHAATPMLDPFSSNTSGIASSLRVTGADWAYLAATGAYSAIVFVFFFLLADYCLRRRSAV